MSPRYSPKAPCPPGTVILEYIDSFGWSQKEFSQRMGRPAEQMNRLIHARIGLTARTAIQLERVLDRPARLWLTLEMNYRLALARKAKP